MKTAIICQAKNEEHYIDEWIDYHHHLGFDDFFIYRDNWNVMTKMMTQEFCHVFDVKEILGECEGVPHNVKQQRVYGKALDRLSDKYDFVAVIDVDEFINLKQHDSIKKFLENYTDVHGVVLNWFIFGDSGLMKVENGNYSCIDRFVKRGTYPHGCVKTIYNLNKFHESGITFDGLVSVHGPTRFNGIKICTPDKKVVLTEEKQLWNCHSGSLSYDIAYINHYSVKTFDEFKIKREKNATSTWWQANKHKWKNIEEYFQMTNTNKVFDDSLKQKYISMKCKSKNVNLY